ncbi:hypothetical protein BgiBS90_020629 [Biomphalaria glabrata]|nr:hypothetical protein BgiBS90_020629 [Biomphalaria glabrata]
MCYKHYSSKLTGGNSSKGKQDEVDIYVQRRDTEVLINTNTAAINFRSYASVLRKSVVLLLPQNAIGCRDSITSIALATRLFGPSC